MTYEDLIRERITRLRLERNLSEYQLSYELGQSKGYIQSITSGRALPSMAMFLEICDYFGLTPAEFFAADLPPLAIREAGQKLTALEQMDQQLILRLIDRLSDCTLSNPKAGCQPAEQ